MPPGWHRDRNPLVMLCASLWGSASLRGSLHSHKPAEHSATQSLNATDPTELQRVSGHVQIGASNCITM